MKKAKSDTADFISGKTLDKLLDVNDCGSSLQSRFQASTPRWALPTMTLAWPRGLSCPTGHQEI